MRNGGSSRSYRHLVGDFDGDGKDDIASISSNGGGGWADLIFVEYGDSQGFRSEARRAGLPVHMRNGDATKSYRHLVGDFDGDGKDDIASISPNGGGGWADSVFVEYGSSQGFKSEARRAGLPVHMRNGDATKSYHHLVGDFDGDGKDDIASISPNGSGGWADSVFVEYGSSQGFRSEARRAESPMHMRNGDATKSYRHLVGDFDGDGKDDIASISPNGGGGWADLIFVEYGRADGFNSQSRTAGLPVHMRNGDATKSYSHVVGDFDGDGKDDITTFSPNGGGGWADTLFVEYGDAQGFNSQSRSAALPVHMRNGMLR